MRKLVRNISFLVIALLLVFCLTLGLAACGDSETTEDSEGKKTEGEETEGEETEDEELAGTIFEAEYIDLPTLMESTTFMGLTSTENTPLVKAEDASNGYCVGNMYNPNSYIEFKITSSAAVTVDLYMCVAMEQDCGDPTSNYKRDLTDDEFAVLVNTEDIESRQSYDTVSFSMRKMDSGAHAAFQEVYLGQATLNAGVNTITMKVNNSNHVGATITATAPLVDYLRIVDSSSTATLSMYIVDNITNGLTVGHTSVLG